MNFFKHRVYLFICLALILSCASLPAQKSGYRFGINLTTMTIKYHGGPVSAQTPVGIHFGMMNEFPHSGKFALQSGFLFSSKGTDFNIDSIYHSIAPAYIEIPVNAAYYFGRRKVKIIVFGGPYLSAAFGGYKIVGRGSMQDLHIGNRSSKDIRCIDPGINLGTSLNIRNFLITVQYGQGLRNVSPVKGLEMKNKVIGISIGTLFKLEK